METECPYPLNELIAIPYEDYRAAPGVCSTDLSNMRESPFHYRFYKENLRKRTKDMEFGVLFHTAVLEPERFMAEYVAEPETMMEAGEEIKIDMRKNICKDFIKEFRAKHAGKNFIRGTDYAAMRGMMGRIYGSAEAARYLKGKTELSVFWMHPEFKVLCKARIDVWCDDGWITDLKKSAVVKPRQWDWKVWEMRYYGQAAWYMDAVKAAGLKPSGFRWLAVKDDSPFDYRRFVANPAMIEFGQEENSRLLGRLIQCEKDQHWPYPDEEHMSMLPDAVLTEAAVSI